VDCILSQARLADSECDIDVNRELAWAGGLGQVYLRFSRLLNMFS